MAHPSRSPEWFYLIGDQRKGPFTVEQLRAILAKGVVGRQVQVWNPAMPAPVPASQLPVFDPRIPDVSTTDAVLELMAPVGNISRMALAAGYLGLFGFVPLVGLGGLALGFAALGDLKRNP